MLFRQMNKNKRTRTSFTVDQLEGLEKYFRESQYVTSADRKMIADRLSLSETQVIIIVREHFKEGFNWVKTIDFRPFNTISRVSPIRFILSMTIIPHIDMVLGSNYIYAHV